MGFNIIYSVIFVFILTLSMLSIENGMVQALIWNIPFMVVKIKGFISKHYFLFYHQQNIKQRQYIILVQFKMLLPQTRFKCPLVETIL